MIEAGGFYEIEAGNATEVPMYLFNYFFDNGKVKNPLFDWYQYTVPQPVSFLEREVAVVLADSGRVSLNGPCSTCKERHWAAAQPAEPCSITGKITSNAFDVVSR